MSSTTGVRLESTFAQALPELSVPWRGQEAPAARMLLLNEPLAESLGLDPAYLRSEDGLRLLVGSHVPDGARPVAQGYAGHQFGGYSPRLGDGRALLLGELTDREGRLVDLHLKGSGRTPWARGGDGLAAVGPMVREYVVSEALHALGVPTTRSLAVVATGTQVLRERALPGAVLARTATSHLRVGSFQYARALDDPALLRRLVEHALVRHHPEAAGAEVPALALLEAVVGAQADLVAQWMLLGFVHGVMNTDNMTISGESIDYGPCAFMEAYDPRTVFSSIDEGGRYAFGNQPAAAQWNLARLAEALLPLVAGGQDQAVAEVMPVLDGFAEQYAAAWASGMRAKLGLGDLEESAAGGRAEGLTDRLLGLLEANHVDHTSFFRRLSRAAAGDAEPVRELFLDLAGIDAWLDAWRSLGPDAVAMERVNPAYIPRNHVLESALEAATEGELGEVEQLLEAVRSPYDERPGLERFAEPAPPDFGSYRTFCGT